MKTFFKATRSFIGNLLWKLFTIAICSLYATVALGIIFPQFSKPVLASIYDGGNQIGVVKYDYYDNSKGTKVKHLPSDDAKTWALIQKKKITTCDELIKVWRPAHLTADDVKVLCTDDFSANISNDSKMNAKTKGIARSRAPMADYSTGPFVIELKRDTPMNAIMDVYSHEAFHVVSFSWPIEKQRAFIASLGETKWSNGTYRSSANELWAWAATSCVALSTSYGIAGNENDIPGGCKAVKKWMKN